MTTYEEFCLWGKARVQDYLRERGLSTTGSRDELRAVAYGAYKLGVPVKATAKEEKVQKAQLYQRLLVVNGQSLPDPFCDLVSGWVGEENGMQNWPPCMYCDIAEYLVGSGERDLRTRLLKGYKEGKSYSYFDSQWLKEVFYHEITPDSTYCFLKANCTPSMKISHDPHKVWVCIEKKTGKVCSAYCSYFAGYVQKQTKNWACHPSTQTIHCKNVMLFGMCMGVFSPLLVLFLACTPAQHVLTHWDRVMHICATKLGHH